MKPKNFPLRKLKRQVKALGYHLTEEQIETARNIRTKINREKR